MALWDEDLARLVAQAGLGEGRPSYRRLEQAARAMGEVVDSAVREPGRSAHVSALSRQIALTMGLPEMFTEAVAIAGSLLDLGQLGVPRHVIDVGWQKPAIEIPKDRSVAEMKAGIAPTFVPGRNAVFLALACAEAAGIGFAPHCGVNTPFGQHLVYALPNSPLAECFVGTPAGVPLDQTTVIPGMPMPKNGSLVPSDAPGFGMEIEDGGIAAKSERALF